MKTHRMIRVTLIKEYDLDEVQYDLSEFDEGATLDDARELALEWVRDDLGGYDGELNVEEYDVEWTIGNED